MTETPQSEYDRTRQERAKNVSVLRHLEGGRRPSREEGEGPGHTSTGSNHQGDGGVGRQVDDARDTGNGHTLDARNGDTPPTSRSDVDAER